MKKRIMIYNIYIILGTLLALFSCPEFLVAKDLPAGALDFPVLFVSNDLNPRSADGSAVDQIIAKLNSQNITVIHSQTCLDAQERFSGKKNIGAIVVDWDLGLQHNPEEPTPTEFINAVREQNSNVPIFLLTGKAKLKDIPAGVMEAITGYIQKDEDTPAFIAGTIGRAVSEYQKEALPPFFKALVTYVNESKYAWSTPGHAGGLGFLASVPGTAFFDFFGENIFRADLSSSMPELGSILEHEGPAGEAEKEAARTFGADYTFFVLNGTSTSNKMVWHGIVTAGDLVLVDRNCHKSVMHAIIMTRAVPVYIVPTRNTYGIIGPIHLKSFEPVALEKAIKESTLIKDHTRKDIRLIVVTNSTYDGLCYDVMGIKDRLADVVENIHFDEAWYGYASSYPLYEGRFGMSSKGERDNHPPTYATQSTHKLLAAFSQASMIHIKNGGRVKVDPKRFNEAFLMHESTSPFYPMFASNDISAKMMSGASGRLIMENAIKEAIAFRKKMVRISSGLSPGDWWFQIWQPDKIKGVPFEDVNDKELMNDSDYWTLKASDTWHGFDDIRTDNIMLDPIKATVLTPGINLDGSMAEKGIPAGIVSKFLLDHGVVPEKTGFYNLLFLFAPGVTKGKTGTLIAKLYAFKDLYDRNALVTEVFPDLEERYPVRYKDQRIQQLCHEMHTYLKEHNIAKMMIDVYSDIPEQVMVPAEAYEELVRGNIEYVPVRNLKGRIPAVMVVPYPPGIPVIMPGERFTDRVQKTVDYLVMCEEFDNRFPGFETEIHGVIIEDDNGQNIYKISCITNIPKED